MGSTRLPGKSLMPIAGMPLVGRVVERARRASLVDEVVLATSDASADEALASFAESVGVRCFRGSESDVLSRILGAAHAAHATVHVQCWGDCAFADPNEIDRVVTRLNESDADLVSNSLHAKRTLPYGLDIIALTVSALERAERETRESPYHREHGTTYIYEHDDAFRVERLPTPRDIAFPKLDLTVNTSDDLEFVRRVYESLLPEYPAFDARALLEHLRRNPRLLTGKNARAFDVDGEAS